MAILGADWKQYSNNGVASATYVSEATIYQGLYWLLGGYDGSYSKKIYTSPDGITFTKLNNSDTSLPAGGHNIGCIVFQGKLWVLGGVYVPTNTHIYNTIDGTNWTETGHQPGGANHAFGLCEFQDKLWIAGGSSYGGGDIPKRKVYSSPDGITWTEAGTDALPDTLYEGRLGVLNNRMYLFGGIYGGSSYTKATNKVWSSTDGITWTEIGTLPNKVSRHNGLVYRGKIWTFGGITEAAGVISKVHYSTDGITWTEAGTDVLSAMQQQFAAAVINDKICLERGIYSSISVNYPNEFMSTM